MFSCECELFSLITDLRLYLPVVDRSLTTPTPNSMLHDNREHRVIILITLFTIIFWHLARLQYLFVNNNNNKLIHSYVTTGSPGNCFPPSFFQGSFSEAFCSLCYCFIARHYQGFLRLDAFCSIFLRL